MKIGELASDNELSIHQSAHQDSSGMVRLAKPPILVLPTTNSKTDGVFRSEELAQRDNIGVKLTETVC